MAGAVRHEQLVARRHAGSRATRANLFGPVDYTIISHVADGHVDAEIVPPQRQIPSAVVIRLRHPEGKAIQSADVSGAKEYTIDPARECIRIVPDTGPIRVRAHY